MARGSRTVLEMFWVSVNTQFVFKITFKKSKQNKTNKQKEKKKKEKKRKEKKRKEKKRKEEKKRIEAKTIETNKKRTYLKTRLFSMMGSNNR